jgi:hypothetical protein
MPDTALQLFSRLHALNVKEIAEYLDLDTLQNLVDVVIEKTPVNVDNLKAHLLAVVHTKMDEVRQKCRLLLWIPAHFSRHLNVLSDTSLAHVTLLLTVFGVENRKRVLTFLKQTCSKSEQPALTYINDNMNNMNGNTQELYDELKQECLYRQYVQYVEE